MSIVGEFPGLELHRRQFRAPVNPLDKSTVVSILPKFIREFKATIFPGTFELEPGSYDKPSILVISSSSWWKDVGEDQPLLEIPQSSIQVADSIVNDYCNSCLGSDMVDSIPGLFFVPGAITVKDLREPKLKPHLDRAKARQDNWYRILVKLADAFWARTNGNPLAISDDMRLAARELGIKDKDWLKDYQQEGNERCPACGTFRNPNYPVCANCHAVLDMKKVQELGIKFAE